MNFNTLHFAWGKRLPVLLQSEVTECGQTCLAMILNYYGHEIDLVTLRQRYPVSLRGSSAWEIMNTAGKLNLSTRSSRIEIEHLSYLTLPCILHWNLDHYVVLKSFTNKRITIHDPARGKVVVSKDEFSKSFTGVVIEFLPNQSFEPKTESKKLRLVDFWSSMGGLWTSLAQIFLMSLALQAFILIAPYHMQLVIDKVFPASDYDLLFVLGIAFGGLILFENLVNGARSWAILYLGSTLNLAMGSRLFNHMLSLPMSYFNKRHVGDIQSRFGSIQAIQEMLSSGFVSGVLDGIMLVITLVVMFFYNVKLTLIAVAATLLYVLIQLAIMRPLKRIAEEEIVKDARENTFFLESLRAMQPVKLFGRERYRHSTWLNYFTNSLNAGIKLNKVKIVFQTVQGSIVGIQTVAIIWVGGYELLGSTLSVGMLYAFLAFSRRFSEQAQNLLVNVTQMYMLKLHLQRIADIVFQEEEKHLTQQYATTGDNISGAIQLNEVCYKYDESDDNILNSINLTIQPGKCLAISGASGCGKSTLLKVMVGLLEPTSGNVLIDNVPLQRLGLRTFRSQIGVVMQDDCLLSSTLVNNICFFDEHIDMEKVELVCKQAQIWDDITQMPMGLHTLIGDMGSSLSGGQQQRLLLARALYREPRIIFMDEATSHLDVKTERCINQFISDLSITRIIVAHRQETLELADEIVDFQQLNETASGTPM